MGWADRGKERRAQQIAELTHSSLRPKTPVSTVLICSRVYNWFILVPWYFCEGTTIEMEFQTSARANDGGREEDGQLEPWI